MSDFSEGQLAAIKAAYALGVQSVTYDGRTTVYRSLAEMERIIATLSKSVNQAGGVAAGGSFTTVAGFKE